MFLNNLHLSLVACKDGLNVCLPCGAGSSRCRKEAGVKLSGKLAQDAIQKTPGVIRININKAVGFRLATKAGETGIVNLSKLVSVIGAVVGGLFDFGTTKVIVDNAYKQFIDGSGEENVEEEHLVDEAEEVLVIAEQQQPSDS